MRRRSILVAAIVAMLPVQSSSAQGVGDGLPGDVVFSSSSLLNETSVEGMDTAHGGSCFSGCCCCDPLWRVSVGAAVLHRSPLQKTTIVEQFVPETESLVTRVDVSDFEFGWNAAVDVNAIRRLNCCGPIDAVDFRYLGVLDEQATAGLTINGGWQFPQSQAFYPGSAIDMSYSSQFQSAELNVRHDSCFRGLTWLAGFRWIGLYERFDTRIQPLLGGNSAYLSWGADNNLFGGQFGASALLWDRGGPLRVESTLKAGVYGNAAENRLGIVDFNGNAYRLASDRCGQVAFVGDIGLVGAYRLTDHIALQGGYQLLWVQGVAAGGCQPAAASSVTHQGISAGDGVFYHGALASIEFRW